MKVSVMVLTYNRSNLLKETIESILNQTFKDFEIIIVDNYSIDNTEEVVKSYNDNRIKYFKNKNYGLIAINKNFAIKQSSGEYIASCDDDDLWFPKKLEKQLTEFEKDESIGLVCSNGFYLYKNDKKRKIFNSRDTYFSFKKLLKINKIICCSVLIKKNVFDDIGIFDEDNPKIFTAEDYEMWLRIAKKYKIKYIGEPLIKYRVHDNNLSKKHLFGEKILKVDDEVYKGLLSKKIIDNTTYNNLIKKLNYRTSVLRLANHGEKIKLQIKFFDKCKLIFLYVLFHIGILNNIRHIKQKIFHIN